MFQQTIKRLVGINHAPVISICNEEHRFLAVEQVRQLKNEHSAILLESEGRDTAPAIALAALHALKDDKNAVLLVLAVDHVIENKKAFHTVIGIAEHHARNDKLVIFGIVTTSAETGYGYVQQAMMVL